MQPHGKPLIVIGVIGTVLILAFAPRGGSEKGNASSPPNTPTMAVATATIPPPAPTATPRVVLAPAPEPATNRQNCNAIRASDYLSADERTWFLANCV